MGKFYQEKADDICNWLWIEEIIILLQFWLNFDVNVSNCSSPLVRHQALLAMHQLYEMPFSLHLGPRYILPRETKEWYFLKTKIMQSSLMLLQLNPCSIKMWLTAKLNAIMRQYLFNRSNVHKPKTRSLML